MCGKIAELHNFQDFYLIWQSPHLDIWGDVWEVPGESARTPHIMIDQMRPSTFPYELMLSFEGVFVVWRVASSDRWRLGSVFGVIRVGLPITIPQFGLSITWASFFVVPRACQQAPSRLIIIIVVRKALFEGYLYLDGWLSMVRGALAAIRFLVVWTSCTVFSTKKTGSADRAWTLPAQEVGFRQV